MATVEEILVPRFRILCVGRVGVGKSSLISRVFGIREAQVSHVEPGVASIDQELVSGNNQYLAVHNSNGFEPGNNRNFESVTQFIRERRSNKNLNDQLHAIWLCTETPRAGGRALEEDDKKLLVLAHGLQIPLVVVFTKYDLLVWTKKLEEEEEAEGMDMDEETLRELSQANASGAFAACVSSLDRSATVLRIQTPPYVSISVSKGYEESLAMLANMTCSIVRDRFECDLWVTCVMALRASDLTMKIEACVFKGVDVYYQLLGAENMLMWQCIAHIHDFIVACWNFEDDNRILGGTGFKQLMLYLVEDVRTQCSATPSHSLDKFGDFVNLITATTINPTVPPVAMLGLSSSFVKWVSSAVVRQTPEVERFLMAYIIDLISVLNSLFNVMRKPGKMSWEVLKGAFEDYEHSNRRKEVHVSCQAVYASHNQALSREIFTLTIKKLLDVSLGLENCGS